MKKILSSKKVTLFLLFLIFLLPGVLAQYVYHHPEWIPSSTTNKGHLVREHIKIPLPGEEKKWRIAFWQERDCATQCPVVLDKLTRIRVALGRRYYQVSQWLM